MLHSHLLEIGVRHNAAQQAVSEDREKKKEGVEKGQGEGESVS